MRYKFGKFLHHFLEGLGFGDLRNFFDLMNEITSGSELAILVLVEISTYFLSQCWLITYQLIDSVSEEAGLTITTVTLFGPAFAKFDLSFGGRILTDLIVDYCHTH